MAFLGGAAQRADPKFLMDRLMRNGMSRMQAAAVVGNMQRESSLISNNINRDEGAYGLMQWRGSRFDALQQFAAKQSLPWTDPGVQMDFLAHEMGGTERKNTQGFYKAQTIDEATAALKPVIRYGDQSLPQRQAFARDLYGAAGPAPQTASAPFPPAPQPGAAPMPVSRETSALGYDYTPGYGYDPVRTKGMRGGLESIGQALGAAISRRARPQPRGQPQVAGQFQAQLSGNSVAPQQIPGAQSYLEPSTGNQVVSGLPGRYSEGDLLNMGRPAPEERRLPGAIPLPRPRPFLDDRLMGGPDANTSVAELGALVDPMRYDYG